MQELNGSIVRNINTPNVGVFILSITRSSSVFKGRVRYFPMDRNDLDLEGAAELFVKDNHFVFEEDRFYKEFELLINPGEIKDFSQAKWVKIRGNNEENNR